MYAANEWLNDIRSNQIHSILRGVGSFSIVCQIIQGMMDLIRLPIQQYQKDRRIIRGLQRGANSFTLNTVMAILELTNKVVGSIQVGRNLCCLINESKVSNYCDLNYPDKNQLVSSLI
ncbi:autophagy-related protein 2 homolog B-like [Aplysia californica]|uniref:Autophagy-related protein 2 n=1 Tax=Aplysia californica TaxID=6500 RepID=A0ABM1VXB0_APLCA|nr:autophagy-related protein 2 homolog B-like [Aplysia californica]